jgi:hypothetical protein
MAAGVPRAGFAAGASASVTTAADGSFTLTAVPTGSTLSITATGFISASYFSVQAGAATTQLGALPLAPASSLSASASGQVVSAITAYGIPGAMITVRPGINALSGTAVLTVAADASGNYHGAFPAGTYTVSASAPGYVTATITVPAVGGVTLGNQNIVLSPTGLGGGSFRFVLTWGASCYQLGTPCYPPYEPPTAAPPDLDGHFVGPKGDGSSTNFEIAYYSKDYYSSSGVLIAHQDKDVTTGLGPETITLNQLTPGHYRYYVHRYCCQENMARSSAKVVVYRGSIAVAQFAVPNQDGEVWTVFELDGSTGSITPINTMSPVYNIPSAGSPSFNLIPTPGAGSDDIRSLLERVRAHPKPSSNAPLTR